MGTIFAGVILLLLGITETPDPIFLIAGVLFAIFALPIFLVVRDPGGSTMPQVTATDLKSSLTQVQVTIDHATTVPGLLRFLLGRFFYSDAVNTLVVVMSVVAVKAVGLTQGQWLLTSIMLTVVAVVASFGWGWLVDRYGPKQTLIAVLVSWVVGLLLGVVSLGLSGTTPGIAIFVIAGAILGSGLGGVQVADRVFMIRLSPPDRLGEFFGLYGLVGKGSQVIGQLLYGVIVFLLIDTLGQRRLPDRGRQPARHDAHRAVAGLAGPRRLVGQRRAPGRADEVAASRPRAPRARERPDRAARGAASRSVRVAARVALPPRPGRSRPSPRVTDAPACQPRTSAARSADATRIGGSPARRGPITTGISRPTTAEAARTTSRLLKPPPLPRLQTSGSGRPGVARRGRLERPQVRVREVVDVDVVADASSRPASGSRRRRAVTGSPRSAARKDGRDEVRLGFVVLAERVAGAGDVEVPKRDAAQPVGRAVPGERALERALRLAVRVDRSEGRVLRDRASTSGVAVDGGGRREDDPTRRRPPVPPRAARCRRRRCRGSTSPARGSTRRPASAPRNGGWPRSPRARAARSTAAWSP